MNNLVCLFAYYDDKGSIPPHVAHYLRELCHCGWQIHLALSGQKEISQEILTFCQPLNITPHPRPNIGWDFGAWQYLIQQGCIDNADRILLANDSVFGPLFPMQPIFESMWSQPVDVWGMVESYENNWHFQSWFLCFTKQAFNHPVIRSIFMRPFHQMEKFDIIVHGELSLGQALKNASSLHCRPIWEEPYKKIFRNRAQLNPMHMDWYSVIRSGCVPFIKTELIRDNPLGIFWLENYRPLLKENQFFSLEWIDHYLKQRPPGSPVYPARKKRLRYLISTFDTKLAWIAFLKHGLHCPNLS